MKRKLYLSFTAVITILGLFSSCKKNAPELCNCSPDNLVISSTVFSTGFNNPRGLKFGPDGHLYVAEGGVGGTFVSTTCAQVAGAGPYTGSNTGSRISRIDGSGKRTTFVDNLPSSATSLAIGGFVSGVADVAFIDNTLYGLLTGAGCSHGVPGIPNQVFKVNHDRTWSMVANISNFLMNNPVANPDPADFEPDGTPYSMVSVDGKLYITQPNQQEIDRISPNTSAISRIIDISILYPGPTNWIGPTSMIYHNGNFYFGTLTPFPFVQGAANVYKLTPDGHLSVFATGFTAILGVTFDELGGLYVIENTTGNPLPTPGTGDIIRLDPSGERLTIASKLNLPTAMTFGPDNKLYVSIWGYGAPPGGGEIWQFDVTCAKNHHGIKK
jgi:hypothetical protein